MKEITETDPSLDRVQKVPNNVRLRERARSFVMSSDLAVPIKVRACISIVRQGPCVCTVVAEDF